MIKPTTDREPCSQIKTLPSLLLFALAVLLPVAALAQATDGGQKSSPGSTAGAWHFHLEEATIDEVHRAIREGQITCHGLVAAYFARAKAYNGVTNELVTSDGKDISAVSGVVRAGSPLFMVLTGRRRPAGVQYYGPHEGYDSMASVHDAASGPAGGRALI